jgi:phosphoribosylpyrophosphate synthetase
MIEVNGIKITPTIFSDKTSQVWKLPQEVFDYINSQNDIIVNWDFESESELFHILQLGALIGEYHSKNNISIDGKELILKMDYLPYARQDKDIDNNLTFALNVFLDLITMYFTKIKVFDPHNIKFLEDFWAGSELAEIVTAEDSINKAIFLDKADVICYPDKGAKERYSKLNLSNIRLWTIGNLEERIFPTKEMIDRFREILSSNHGGSTTLTKIPSVCMEKVRDQTTGNIMGIKLVDDTDLDSLNGKRVLIVDDICDGGRTFIEAAKVLYENGVSSVSLYTSHGIYSKGLDILFDAGIHCIYDKGGLVGVK